MPSDFCRSIASPRFTCSWRTTLGLPSTTPKLAFSRGTARSARSTAKPMRCVKRPCRRASRARWLLRIWRLTSSSLAGTARTDVAVGTSRLASMFSTMRAAAPRSGSGVSPSSTTGRAPVVPRRLAPARARAPVRGGCRAARRGRRGAAVRRPATSRRAARSRRRTRASRPTTACGFSWNRRYISSTGRRWARARRVQGYRVGHAVDAHRRTSSARRNARSSDWRALSRGSQRVSYAPRGASPRTSSPPPRHSVTSSPVSSTCTPPGQTSSARQHVEELLDLVHHRVEVAGLVAALVHERVAVHRVARPHDRVAGALHRPQQRRAAARRRCRRPCGSTSVSRPGSRPGSRRRHSVDHVVGRRVGPDLHADRVLHAREELDVRAVELAGALTDPQQVRGAVVPVAGEAVAAGERLLVAEQQRLVRRVEVDLVQLRPRRRGRCRTRP